MICPFCGGENPQNASFCQYCGARIEDSLTRRKKRIHDLLWALGTAAAVIALFYGIGRIVTGLWQMWFDLNYSPAVLSPGQYYDDLQNAYAKVSTYLLAIADLFVIVVLAAFFRIAGESFRKSVGLLPVRPTRFFSAFVVGLTAQIPLGFIIAFIPFDESVFEEHAAASVLSSAAPLYIQIIATVIVAPIVEEIMFRGLIFDRFRRAVPKVLASLITSVLFALVHGDAITMIAAFIFSMVFCYMYSRHGSIAVSIAMHMGFNAVSFIISSLDDPVLTLAAFFASTALFIGGAYLLLRRDEVY